MFVYFQKTTLRPCGFQQQRGIDRTTPTMKTEEKQSRDGRRWQRLAIIAVSSCVSLQVAQDQTREGWTCITTICPPSRIEISLLTCTHKELFDTEIGTQKNCWPRKKLTADWFICLSAQPLLLVSFSVLISVFLVSHDLRHLREIMNNINWWNKTDPEKEKQQSDSQSSEEK